MFFKTKSNPTIEELASREVALLAQRRAAERDLELAQAEAGEALVFAGDESAPAIAGVQRLKTQISVVNNAIHVCRSKRLTVLAEECGAEAAKMRSEAGRKSTELASIQAKRSTLTDELTRLEGVSVAIVPAAPGGITDRLREEISRLETRAESQAVRDYGNVDIEVTSTAEIVLAVLNHKSLGPSAEEIEAWAAAVELTAKKNRPNATFGASVRKVYLSWKNSVILAGESTIFVRDLAPRSRRRLGLSIPAMASPEERERMREKEPTEDWYDVKAATFRAAA